MHRKLLQWSVQSRCCNPGNFHFKRITKTDTKDFCGLLTGSGMSLVKYRDVLYCYQVDPLVLNFTLKEPPFLNDFYWLVPRRKSEINLRKT